MNPSSQDTQLFNSTIAYNIGYGSLRSSADHVV